MPGKDHKIADALSRFPVFSPDASIDVPVAEVMQCQRTYNAAGLDVIFRAIDKDYKLIISAIMSKQKSGIFWQAPKTKSSFETTGSASSDN